MDRRRGASALPQKRSGARDQDDEEANDRNMFGEGARRARRWRRSHQSPNSDSADSGEDQQPRAARVGQGPLVAQWRLPQGLDLMRNAAVDIAAGAAAAAAGPSAQGLAPAALDRAPGPTAAATITTATIAPAAAALGPQAAPPAGVCLSTRREATSGASGSGAVAAAAGPSVQQRAVSPILGFPYGRGAPGMHLHEAGMDTSSEGEQEQEQERRPAVRQARRRYGYAAAPARCRGTWGTDAGLMDALWAVPAPVGMGMATAAAGSLAPPQLPLLGMEGAMEAAEGPPAGAWDVMLPAQQQEQQEADSDQEEEQDQAGPGGLPPPPPPQLQQLLLHRHEREHLPVLLQGQRAAAAPPRPPHPDVPAGPPRLQGPPSAAHAHQPVVMRRNLRGVAPGPGPGARGHPWALPPRRDGAAAGPSGLLQAAPDAGQGQGQGRAPGGAAGGEAARRGGAAVLEWGWAGAAGPGMADRDLDAGDAMREQAMEWGGFAALMDEGEDYAVEEEDDEEEEEVEWWRRMHHVPRAASPVRWREAPGAPLPPPAAAAAAAGAADAVAAEAEGGVGVRGGGGGDGGARMGAGEQAAEVVEVAPSVQMVVENGDLVKAILSSGLSVVDLCRAACVCGTWRHVVDDPAFWARVALSDRSISPEQVVRMARRHRGAIQELRLSGSSLGDGAIFNRLLPNLPRLTVLELRRSHLTDRAFTQLSAGLPQLRELLLHDMHVCSFTNSNAAVADATLNHPALTRLDLSCFKAGRLSLSCPALTHLSISNCQLASLAAPGSSLPSLTRLDLTSLSRMPDASAVASITTLTTLRTLSITEATLSEDLVRNIARSLEHLTSLELASCSGWGLSARRGNVAFTPALRVLRLASCDSLTSGSLSLLVEGCGGLEELGLDGCGGLTAVSLSLPSLRGVSLKGCRGLVSLDLRCRRLEDLALGPREAGGSGGASLKRVSVSSEALRAIRWRHFPSLEEVALDCPALTHLALADCDSLGDAIFAMLTDVEELHVARSAAAAPGPTVASPQRGASGTGNTAFVPKAGGCPRLQDLRLEGCEGLRDCRLRHSKLEHLSLRGCRGLQALRLHCPQLGRSAAGAGSGGGGREGGGREAGARGVTCGGGGLVLEECTELTHVALTAGVDSLSLGACGALREADLWCPALVALSLKGCGALRRVALHCPALQQLDATFCSELEDMGLIRMLSSRPPLSRVVLSVCSGLGPDLPVALAQLAQLADLDLSYTAVGRVRPLLAGCSGLTRLCLGSCRELQATELLDLLPSNAHALPFLTHLDASYCPLPSAVVVPLARDVTRLKELALNGCAGVDDSLWRAVATRPGLPPPPPSPPPSPPGQQRRPGSGAHRRYSDRAGRYGHGDGGPGGCAARGSSMGMDRPRAGVATRRQRLGMDAVYDRDAGGFGGASGSGGWQLTLAGPRRLGDVSARGAGGPSGLGSPTRRRHAGATAGPASAPTLFPASGAQAGGGRAAAGGDMTSLAVTLSLLSSEAEDEAMGPPAASVFFDSGANSDDGEDGPGPMGRPWGSQEDRRAKGGSSAAAASCAGGATAARSCGAGGAGTQPAVPYGGGVRAGHARSTALAALPESLPASQLERLSLVRCTALKSLCLGLMPLQEQQQQLQNVDRAGVVWWPPPQQLAQASGPGCGWVPVGCVLSNLRSLRLGLSAVQTVALALEHLTHLDLNGCGSLRALELRTPALAELHLQGCRALPAAALGPLLRGGNGRGLALMDAQHSGELGAAVGAAVEEKARAEVQEEAGAGAGPSTSAGVGGQGVVGQGVGGAGGELWSLLPRGGTVLVCGADCSTCGRHRWMARGIIS